MAEVQNSPTEGKPPRGRFTIVYMIHEAFRRDLEAVERGVASSGRGSVAERSSSARIGRSLRISSITTMRWRTHHCGLSYGRNSQARTSSSESWPKWKPSTRSSCRSARLLAGDSHPWCNSPSAEAGHALAGSLDTLGIELGSHLEDEELRCFPVIDHALTPEEFESFGKATAKAIGMRGSAKFFPWIFDTANPLERKAVLSMPPPPVGVLCQYVWEPRYTRKVASIWTD